MLISSMNESLSSIKGIGKASCTLLEKLGVTTISDLLNYYPRAYSDRTKLLSFMEAVKIGAGTVRAKVIDHRLIGSKFKKFLKIILQDDKGTFAVLLCFNRNFLKNSLIKDNFYYITGKFQYNYNEIQSSSFEYEDAREDYEGKILPVYSLTEGLTQNSIRRITDKVINSYIKHLDDDLPPWCIEEYDLLNISQAIRNIHYPVNFELYYKARRTLIFHDFFYQKLFMLYRREKNRKIGKAEKNIKFHYKKSVLDKLPFKLMDYQSAALKNIEQKQFSDEVFSILLQGDVGSGKTIIALLTMLNAVEAGYQAVLLAPTEVLALQHYKNIKKMTEDLWIDIAVLRGNMPKKDKDNILSGIKNGEIKIVIGTHSVFSDNVEYNNLGIAVIDEQHRFGVEQRCRLLSKGKAVDLLLMTATPIPQSLSLSLYGDLDLITMKGHINGRIPVKTWVIDNNEERLNNMHEWIKNLLKEEGRAIFVYPLIEDTEKSDNKNLTDEYKKLNTVYSEYGCEFIYSGTPSEDKERIIDSFREGKIKVLVSTTVVEVGLDVPDANVIVVENADNYGLSTLHQLRGRVGRNNKQGYMVLAADMNRITDDGKKRLELLRNETDGFKISEEDLIMRGPGDFIGNRQSGIFNIKLADIKKDMETLLSSCKAAEKLILIDPYMEKLEHMAAKETFYKKIEESITKNL